MGDQERTQEQVSKEHGSNILASVRQDIVRVKESMGMLSETQGEMLRRFIGMETRISYISSIATKTYDEMSKRNAICDTRHDDIDERLDSISDEDGTLEADTGVYASMDGHEVKSIIAEERKAREALQSQVEAMRMQDKIHRAEKDAVAVAKNEWEQKTKSVKVEHGRLASARYGMYGAIGVALIAAVGSVVVSVLNAGGH